MFSGALLNSSCSSLHLMCWGPQRDTLWSLVAGGGGGVPDSPCLGGVSVFALISLVHVLSLVFSLAQGCVVGEGSSEQASPFHLL